MISEDQLTRQFANTHSSKPQYQTGAMVRVGPDRSAHSTDHLLFLEGWFWLGGGGSRSGSWDRAGSWSCTQLKEATVLHSGEVWPWTF